MNGARSTYMRKGYLPTALAAAVLLAASSGTAWAQEEPEFTEGEETTRNVWAGASVGTDVGDPVKATDPDGDDITYSGGTSDFDVDPETGQLSIAQMLTHPAADAAATVVTVTATADGETDTIMVEIEFDVITLVADYGAKGIRVSLPAKAGVDEGDELEVDVSIRAIVPETVTDDSDVTLYITGASTTKNMAEDDDWDIDGVGSSGSLGFTFDEGNGRSQTVTETFVFEAEQDDDAEKEGVVLTIALLDPDNPTTMHEAENFELDAAAAMALAQTREVTISDDETQSYTLELDRNADPKEGGEFMVKLEADPEFESESKLLELRVVNQAGKKASNYGIAGDGVLDGVNTDRELTITVSNDKNRVTDTVTLEGWTGGATDGKMVTSLDIVVADIHTLPDGAAITAMAMDEANGGTAVTQVVEGGDPVYLTVTVDRGSGSTTTTNESLTIDVQPANPSQASDFVVEPIRVTLEDVSRSNGKQSTDAEIKLSARDDDNDVGMEYLVLNLVVSGSNSKLGTEISTGTFSIAIVDTTAKKVSPKSEAEAYPMIRAALGQDPETTVMEPGETGTIMMGDLFTVMDGYDASYKVSESGGAVSVTAPGDMVTITANAAGTSKVTVTATAEMMASAFKPEQTVSDVASITFEVMVEEEMPEPVPALPLFGQLLLALFMTAGGARLYRRRQG